MTQEEKILLFRELCARLPYGVMCRMSGGGFETIEDKLTAFGLFQFVEEGLECVPYLRPMSSMTEKEFYELCELGVSLPPFKDYYGQMQYYGSGGEWSIVDVEIEDIIKYVNYLNAHYFDYNGLIEKGLALEAPEGMY